MLINKILFVLKRYSYNDYKISLLKNLIFLLYANNLNKFKSSKNAIFENSSKRILIFNFTANVRDFAYRSISIANSRSIILLLFFLSSFSIIIKNNLNINFSSNNNNVILNICEIATSIYYNLTRKKKL